MRLTASSTHMAFMVCDEPIVAPTTAIMVARNASEIHSTRRALQSRALFSGGKRGAHGGCLLLQQFPLVPGLAIEEPLRVVDPGVLARRHSRHVLARLQL